MITIYSRKQIAAQKKVVPTVASVLDSSSQNKLLQRKADMANNATQRAEAPRPNNTGMPDNLKSGIESLSGFSMDDVRVHYNSSKPATVQALAYTQGTDIHVAPGQEKHLPHEAWHVAQQMVGRVSPTTNINGMPVNDNAGLEHEADVMGEKAVQCKGKTGRKPKKKKLGVIQCLKIDSENVTSGKDLRENKDLCKKIETLGYNVSGIYGFNDGLYDDISFARTKSVKDLFELLQKCSTKWTYIYNHIKQLGDSLSGDPNTKGLFFTDENINRIIGKFFDINTGAVLSRTMNNLIELEYENMDIVLSTIKICIEETLGDIDYWTRDKDVKKIDLTDSDVHCRGVGVCIITYNTPEGEKKCVIKPEDKSLENAIYGTDENSLAAKFGNIGTLDIQVSPNDNFHGSKVQYFEHEDLRQIGDETAFAETDEGSINDMLRFISILGLGDLHRENLVYSKKSEDDSKRKMQMIDAEIALNFRNEPNPFALDTETYLEHDYSITTDMRNRFEKKSVINEYNKCIELLDKAQEQFSGKKSRLVPIGTPQLYKYRKVAYLWDFQRFSNNYTVEYCDIVTNHLKQLTGNNSLELNCNKDHFIAMTYIYLKSGRIPYFEYEFDSGIIYQKITDTNHIELYQSESLRLKNVIERRKRILKIAFEKALTEQLLNSLKHRITYQAPSQQSQSEEDSNSEWT